MEGRNCAEFGGHFTNFPFAIGGKIILTGKESRYISAMKRLTALISVQALRIKLLGSDQANQLKK